MAKQGRRTNLDGYTHKERAEWRELRARLEAAASAAASNGDQTDPATTR